MVKVHRLCLAAALGMLMFGWAADCYAEGNHDKMLQRLDAIEKMLGNLEKTLNNLSLEQLIGNLEPSAGQVQDTDGKSASKVEGTKNFLDESNLVNETSAKTTKTTKSSKEFLIVTNWVAGSSRDVIDNQVIDIYYTIKNMTTKTISMVDGGVVFRDKFGEIIGWSKIGKDINLSAYEEKSFGRSYIKSFKQGFERLVNIHKKSVDVSVDIDKLMFSDGEVVIF